MLENVSFELVVRYYTDEPEQVFNIKLRRIDESRH